MVLAYRSSRDCDASERVSRLPRAIQSFGGEGNAQDVDQRATWNPCRGSASMACRLRCYSIRAATLIATEAARSDPKKTAYQARSQSGPIGR
jgi:hypothetical protein